MGSTSIKRDGAEDIYTLGIIVLYSTQADEAKAEAAANEAREQIEAAFRTNLFAATQGWQYIELRDCMVLSDQAMTVAQSQALKQWRLEHMSLREEPYQPMLNE
jgi:hypothetical protein